MLLTVPLMASTLALSSAFAAQICSPTTCVDGMTSSPLLAADKKTDSYLIPGVYPVTADSKLNVALLSLTANLQANISISATFGSLTVSNPQLPLTFTDKEYQGVPLLLGDKSWGFGKSVVLPEGWYAVINPGQVVWGTVPDTAQLPAGLAGASLSKAALSTCNPACSSNGVCTSTFGNNDTDNTASCTCAFGWTGAICDTCSPGFFGPSCSPCPSNCLLCDDTLQGTGSCLGTTSTAKSTCNCGHGTCNSDGSCTCSSGHITNSSLSTEKCNTCSEGFFRDASGNCLACPLGCESCQLKSGTLATPSCASCAATLSLSTEDPVTCTTSTGSCNPAQYFDDTSSTCQPCSPACSTCTGPSPASCLSCASPRVNLKGNCVGFSPSNGVCDTSLSGLEGMFVVNNAKAKCDSCPAGCLDCSISSFSSAANYDNLTCSTCQQGYLLEDGKCVDRCSEGFFLPSGGAAVNGTCQTCDKTCTSCLNTSTYCTSCPSPLFASNGGCTDSCPSGTVPNNGTCLSCHGDCATCSKPGSATSCTACPASRPVLSNGQCLEYCPRTSYLDTTNGSCKSCDASCSSCSGPATSSCTSCPTWASHPEFMTVP